MKSISIRSQIRAAALPAVALLVIAYFASSALFGPNGIFALGGYNHTLEQRSAQLAKVEAERDILRHRNTLLDPRRVDADYGDELVRRVTGQVRPDEVVIPLR